MVQAWYSLTANATTTKNQNSNNSNNQNTNSNDSTSASINNDNNDDQTEVESVSSLDTDDDSSSGNNKGADTDKTDEDEERFIVRRLLRPGRVPAEFHGRQGAATEGVDTAVRMETAITILAALFLLGLGTAPLRVLALSSPSPSRNFTIDTKQFWQSFDRAEQSTQSSLQFAFATLSLTWWLFGLLYGIWVLFLRSNDSTRIPNIPSGASPRQRALKRTILNVLDLTMLIGTATYVFSGTGEADRSSGWTICWFLGVGVTAKSHVQAATATTTGVTRSRIFSTIAKVVEFVGKLMLLRRLVLLVQSGESQSDSLAWIETTLSLGWALWVVSNPIPTRCELAGQRMGEKRDVPSAADVVFLGHPAELVDCWALWLLPYSLSERWKGPVWAYPLWPIHYLVGWYVCNYRRKFFGDKASFFCCDDVIYGSIRMQTWTASHFGRHFVTHPLQVKQNIEAAARHAERTGVKVLCLGALNKAESINSGGVGVVRALGHNSKLSVIHGNHLTAAAVVETTVQCFGEKAKVFLTGASSKVGWAVAQGLRDRHGYEVLCHSTDPGRRKFFHEEGFEAAAKLSEGTHFSKLWIVGKYDLAVPHLIPQNATAVVFSVPHSLGSRLDVRVIEAGTLHMDLSRLDRPRQFTNKLCEHEIFACHAASAVAAGRLKRDGVSRILEIGPVDPLTMDTWLDDAKKLGFQVPTVSPLDSIDQKLSSAPVVIVGAGPSGLAVAAALTRQNVPNVILECQEDPTQFGSWDKHFSDLEVTSQAKWCQLPNFPIHKCGEWKGEYITAQEYRRYLQLYAARFGLQIRRGVQVMSIEKGHDPQKPWTVQICPTSSNRASKAKVSDPSSETGTQLSASAVVVATGKHRIPFRNTSDNLAERLEEVHIPYCHTADIRDESTWNQAIQAAQTGRLAIIGFGNSASDIATAILRQVSRTASVANTSAPKIHIAARSVPPVFPRRASVLRVDTIGWFVRQLSFLQLDDLMIKLLWWALPGSRTCNAAFPSHLARWKRIQGRVPVIDKYGTLTRGFKSGQLVGHGPVLHVIDGTKASCCHTSTAAETATLTFDDGFQRDGIVGSRIPIEMVIFATGYRNGADDDDDDSLVTGREDRLNGLYHCGLGNDQLLPLQSIGEQALGIAHQIATDFGRIFYDQCNV
eukprot:scaffold15309_cov198-Amphora_coffeaeformis.AAC.6